MSLSIGKKHTVIVFIRNVEYWSHVTVELIKL